MEDRLAIALEGWDVQVMGMTSLVRGNWLEHEVFIMAVPLLGAVRA